MYVIEVVNYNWALTYVSFMDERAFDYMLKALFIFATIPEAAKIKRINECDGLIFCRYCDILYHSKV